MKWIMEQITPAGVIVVVSVAIGAVCVALLAVGGPVTDFGTEMIRKVTTM